MKVLSKELICLRFQSSMKRHYTIGFKYTDWKLDIFWEVFDWTYSPLYETNPLFMISNINPLEPKFTGIPFLTQ